ncbi:MAG: acetolactate synthase small subunit [Deltaproteobacteria bacterium]|nr:acetolactate synthase small subunit [Deltaproteobacteria bacterium]MBI4374197.1 acetolactate synthase small subunit [Deltaproteobacteria bacterium]
MEKKHTISVLVENEFGALARIAGLFAQKGYNIEALHVEPCPDDKSLSQMTIVTIGSDPVLQQIMKQLDKLINVLKVEEITSRKSSGSCK